MVLLCFARRALSSSVCLGVNSKHLWISAATGSHVRKYSRDSVTAPGHFVCCHLPHRTLVKIQGEDTGSFLQGIITNDMRLLLEEPAHGALYSHMLNVQGRILFDIMLYRLKETNAGHGVFLECDDTIKDSILRHLKMYKIRRNVSISACPDLSVWAVLPQQKDLGKPQLSSPEKVQVWEADPRTEEMGWRVVLDSHTDPRDVIASSEKADTEEYHRHRYSVGIPEGVKDLPPGVALPLESNLVYMQGISFSKGCYIGQELTARTHHTGVIRKRLMPVQFSSPVHDLEEGAALQTQSLKPAGKHRAALGNLGLGLIRLVHAQEVLTVKSADNTVVTLEVSVPGWWPKDNSQN